MEPHVLKWREPREAFSKNTRPAWLADVIFLAFLVWFLVSLAQHGEWLHLVLLALIALHSAWIALKWHIREFYTLSEAGITMFPGRLHRHIAWRDLAWFRLSDNAVLVRARSANKLRPPLFAFFFDPQEVDRTTLHQFLCRHLPEKEETDLSHLNDGEEATPRAAQTYGLLPSTLSWKEPPHAWVVPKWLAWGSLAFSICVIAWDVSSGHGFHPRHLGLLGISLVLLAGGLSKSCRLDRQGVSVTSLDEWRRVPWSNVKEILLTEDYDTASGKITILTKGRWAPLYLTFDAAQVNKQQIVALVRRSAPDVKIW